MKEKLQLRYGQERLSAARPTVRVRIDSQMAGLGGAAVTPAGAALRGGLGAAGSDYGRNIAAPADNQPRRCAR
jgi:hypothetical protein